MHHWHSLLFNYFYLCTIKLHFHYFCSIKKKGWGTDLGYLGNTNSLILKAQKTSFLVGNKNDNPWHWHYWKTVFISLIRSFRQAALLEPLAFPDTSASWPGDFPGLHWIHSWFAGKLLLGLFRFCCNPWVITKSLSATIGKS